VREKHAFVYDVRNELLRSFGYRTYKQYLKSEEWSAIRSQVFDQYDECICCDSKPQVVHHVKYDSGTLLGLHRLHLAPLCNACHELMEIHQDGSKASLARANTLMFDMARKKNPKQAWLIAFYKERSAFKGNRSKDALARKDAFRRKREAAANDSQPRDYSGVFWVRARRRK
jgi:hypothetical protein